MAPTMDHSAARLAISSGIPPAPQLPVFDDRLDAEPLHEPVRCLASHLLRVLVVRLQADAHLLTLRVHGCTHDGRNTGQVEATLFFRLRRPEVDLVTEGGASWPCGEDGTERDVARLTLTVGLQSVDSEARVLDALGFL